MRVLYDTRTVHPLDRYDHYREGAAGEVVPVGVHGRAPGHLLAAMSVAQVGDFEIETMTCSADSEVVRRRTERLIRAGDPECYRIGLCINDGLRLEQAGNQATLRARDIALWDLSIPVQTTHPTGPMRTVMLTFPRALVPIAPATVRPLLGTAMPRSLPGLSLLAQFLIGLTDIAATGEQARDPGLAEILHECAVGLICQRLGLTAGITPRTSRLLQMARIRGIIRRHLADAELDPGQIAEAANISLRYLHKICQDAGITPMQLVKRLRLEECRRSLQDPALARTPINDIRAAHGYRRPDQFARDFKQQFDVSPKQARSLASQQPPGHER